MKKTIFTAFTLLMVSSPSIAGETISGTPVVINGTTMMVGGKTVHLFGIKGPKDGTLCAWKSKRMIDCAKLASAGLKDITVASTVVCTAQIDKTYVCKADGFDLAYGLIHAGWALPNARAPKSYFAKADNARAHKRGLWHAVNSRGQIIAQQIEK